MDYAALQASAHSRITSLGFPITVTRGGQAVGKGSAVVAPRKQKEDDQGAALMTVNELTLVVTSTSTKFAPQVGDRIDCKQGTWRVKDAEEIKPSTVSIAWLLKVA